MSSALQKTQKFCSIKLILPELNGFLLFKVNCCRGRLAQWKNIKLPNGEDPGSTPDEG
jgi:hypothetical protein